eukprot:4264828-Lingulodinium_polyedra.AAC.1
MAWAVPADVLEATRTTWRGHGCPAAQRRRTRELPATWQPGQHRGENEEVGHLAGRGRSGQ